MTLVPVPDRFRRASAIALALLLFCSVLTLWVRERWALSTFQLGVFLLGGAWAARMAWRPFPVRGHILLAPLGGAVLWGLAQAGLGWTVYAFDTWNAVLYWATAFVLFFLSIQILSSPEIRTRFLRALLFFSFALSVVSTIQLFTSAGKVFWIFQTQYTDKVVGPFLYHNNYAAFIELTLPLALVAGLRDRRKAYAFALMGAAMIASVIASTSRAGSVLVAAETVAILAIAYFRRAISGKTLFQTAWKVGLFAALFIAVVGWDTLLKRFQAADPYVHRREMLASAVAMARERPLTGFGLGTFQTAYPAYALFDIGLIVNHAHNDWAEWAAEGGLPFLLLTVWIGAWSVAPAVRSLWGLGAVAVFLHGLVDYPMQRLGLAAWVFVILGALAASGRRESETPTP